MSLWVIHDRHGQSRMVIYVRFAPKVDIVGDTAPGPLCANRALTQRSKSLSTRSPLWRTRGRMMKPSIFAWRCYRSRIRVADRLLP